MNRRDFVKLSPAFATATAVTASLTIGEDGKPPIEGLSVSVLKLQPGDVVVITCEGHLSSFSAARIKAMWEQLVPKTTTVILSDGIKVEGVLRP